MSRACARVLVTMKDQNDIPDSIIHVPVMLSEALDALNVRTDGTYLDGTFGRGGHARGLLQRLGAHGRLLLMDRDPAAVDAARREFSQDTRVAIRHSNFADLADWDTTTAGLDGVLLDLGVSSPQLDDAERGFSFQADAPLDMRMDPSHGESAAEFLARASQTQIERVLWQFGEERMGRRIARAIVEQRQTAPIARTGELADLVARTLGRRDAGKHPATRSFQALRIAVNGELDALTQGMQAALERLKPGGRLAVISFHSLEDRIVKRFLRGEESPTQPPKRVPVLAADLPSPRLRLIGKPVFPGEAELKANPRCRSAVMRVAEKL